jgi:hypothetical protein
MANPNIVGITSLYGKSISQTLANTSLVGVLTNANNSNRVLKINTVRASNIDGAVAADISVGFSTVGAATTQFLARTISVPADASLVVVDKTSTFYLEENQNILAQASAANDIDLFISYEEIT